MKRSHRNYGLKASGAVAVRSPRPYQAPDTPLQSSKPMTTSKKREFNGTIGPTPGTATTLTGHTKDATGPGHCAISSCAVSSLAIGSVRGIQEAVGGWAGKQANGRRHLCDPHRAAGSTRDANRSDTSPATLLGVVFKPPSLGGSVVSGRSSKSNQFVVLDCITFAQNCTVGMWSTPQTVRFGPTCPMLGVSWPASSDEIVHE